MSLTLLLFAGFSYGVISYRNHEARFDRLPQTAQFMLQTPVTEESGPVIAALAATAWRHQPSSEAWNAMQRVSFIVSQGSYWHDDLQYQALIVPKSGPTLLNLSDAGAIEMLKEDDSPGTVVVRRRRPIVSFTVSPNSRHVAAAVADGTVFVSDLETGRVVADLPIPSPIRAMAFSLDGGFLALVDQLGKASVWDVPSGKAVGSAPAMAGAKSVALSRGAQYLAMASDEHVSITSLADGRLCAEIKLFDSKGPQLAFSSDGQLLTIAERDGKAQIYPVEGSHSFMQIPSPRADDALLSADGRHLAMAYTRGEFRYEVRLISVADGYELEVEKGEGQYGGMVFSPDGRTLAVHSEQTSGGGGIDVVKFWSFEGAERESQRINKSAFGPTALSSDGKLIATLAEGGRVVVRDASNAQASSFFHVGDSDSALAFNSDSSRLSTWSDAGDVRVWNVVEKREVAKISTQKKWLAVSFSADGSRLLAVTEDPQLHLAGWSPARFSEQRSLAVPDQGWAVAAAFTPDARRLAVLYQDSEREICCLYSMPEGTLLSSRACASPPKEDPDWIDGEIDQIALSPDGRYLAIGQSDDVAELASARLIETSTGKVSGVFRCEFSSAGVRFSPDGKYLGIPISLAERGAVRLLSVPGWKEAVRIHHARRVSDLSFCSSQLLATFGDDGSVRVWDTDWAAMLNRLCLSPGRNLSRDQWNRHLNGLAWRATCNRWPTPAGELKTPVETPAK